MLYDLKNRNVYHGSYTLVREPDLERCASGKDFGKGFYITTDRSQAINFARLVARRYGSEKGVLNIYRFSDFDGLEAYEFSDTDASWLNCVVGYRRRKFRFLSEPFDRYEVLMGKIADDDTSQVINAYMAGVLGTVGSEEAVKLAVQRLEANKLRNQICFKSVKALQRLAFFKGEDVWL